MKTRQWIFIVLLSTLAMACSDQTRTLHTLEGNVFFKDTMEPMDDIALSYFQNNGKEGFQTEILGSTQLTLADGSYRFEFRPFKNDEAGPIFLSAAANSSIQLAFNTLTYTFPIVFEEIDPALVLEDDTYTLDILGEPFSFLELEFSGQQDLFVGEELKVTVSGIGYKHETTFKVGDDLTKVYSYPVRGRVRSEVAWESNFGGIVKLEADSVFCKVGENRRFRVNL
jgi:hypothetical protein